MQKKRWSPVTISLTKNKKPHPYFTPEDTRKVFRKSDLGIKLPALKDDEGLEKIIADLEEAAIWYFSFKNQKEKPKGKQIKRSLENVQKTAKAFYECLLELDFATKYERLRLSVKTYDSLLKDVGFITYRAEKVITEFKTTAHRPRSLSARINFILNLIDIYEYATVRTARLSRSHGEPGGPFFRFVKNCINHIDGPISIKDEALFKSIRTALNHIDKYRVHRKASQ